MAFTGFSKLARGKQAPPFGSKKAGAKAAVAVKGKKK